MGRGDDERHGEWNSELQNLSRPRHETETLWEEVRPSTGLTELPVSNSAEANRGDVVATLQPASETVLTQLSRSRTL